MPTFSIVIPTVDRPEVLRAVLTATLDMAPKNCEIVVSDNYSDIRTGRVLRRFTDARLRLIRTNERLSISDHWEWIWPQLAGDYIIYTGDDSVALPSAFTAAEVAITKYKAEIISWRVAHYYHPDWNVRYAHYPTRGNIIGLSADFTNRFFRVNSLKVLREFAKTLRLAGGFPGMQNFLIKRALGDKIRERVGRLHWAPAPDISASTLALAVAGTDRYLFWDGLGALGGRSRNSHLAGILSRGLSTTRLREYLDDYLDVEQRFPLHDVHIESITNILAATLTQARRLLPELSSVFEYSKKTLAMKLIDDAFYERTVAELGFPTFLHQLNVLIDTVSQPDRSEVLEYLDSAKLHADAQEEPGVGQKNPTPSYAKLDFIKSYIRLLRSNNSRVHRLRRATKRNPIDLFWTAGGEDFIDMRLFRGRTIADVHRALPTVLKEFATETSAFVDLYEKQDILKPVSY